MVIGLRQQQIVADLRHQLDTQCALQGFRRRGVVFAQQVDLGQLPQHLAVGDIRQPGGGQRGAIVLYGLVVLARLHVMTRQVSAGTGLGVGIGDRGDLALEFLDRQARASAQVRTALDAYFAAVLALVILPETGQGRRQQQQHRKVAPGWHQLNQHWAYWWGSSARTPRRAG